ncbi:hypothetical protein ABFT80_23790 [Mesorhizobium sp. SB112]|uniref:hypothetical protein n=1 Tax=Mesorhizobium sp. SB112 TaxID=3151853 RepID=UPI003263433C
MTSDEHAVAVVEIPPQFETYTAAALLRVQCLFPALRFAQNQNGVKVYGSTIADEESFRRTLLHAVYREKIYAETLSMRRDLISAVTA